MSAFIGVDWGSTNLRAWRIVDGRIEASIEAPLGVQSITQREFAHVFAAHVQAPLGADLPALLCGMIGSTIGWREAPYVSCPTRLRELASRAIKISDAPTIKIVPGLSCVGVTRASDVMRGEETQILGYLGADPARQRGKQIVCLPGTHSKWAAVRDGVVERFVTAMTGELFALLTKHSILKSQTEAFDADAFAKGSNAAAACEALSLSLFSARSRIVADGADPSTSASYLSGLLIGSEVIAASRALDLSPSDELAIIASPKLAMRYRDVLKGRGAKLVELDGGEAACMGLSAFVREGALQ